MQIKNGYRVEYLYNTKSNTVTALATITSLDKNFCEFKKWCDYITKSYQAHKTVFSGVARLKSGDENNLAVAKRIARCKALRQANRYYGNLIFKMQDILREKLVLMATVGNNAILKTEKYNQEIMQLTKKEA